MKCTVKEMIDYLSCFPPEALIELTSHDGSLFSVYELDPTYSFNVWGTKILSQFWDEDELPESPVRNKSLGYTSENYSD